MDGQELAKARAARLRMFRVGLAATALGVAAVVAGFALGRTAEGDAATGAGVLAGVGFSLALVGAVLAALYRPGDGRWMTEVAQGKRDRLQSQRSSQLFLFPAVAVIFFVLAVDPMRDVVEGNGALRDYLSILLPVLYAWVTTAITMGWDANSLKNRRYLEDELTVVIRARAMTAAFFTMMAGATVALALTLTLPHPAFGAIALLATIAGGGLTAGVRFAWLDREAGRDG